MKNVQYFVIVSYVNPMVGIMTCSTGDRFYSIEDTISYIENELHAVKSDDLHYVCAVNGDVWVAVDDEIYAKGDEFWIEKAVYEDGIYIGGS